MSADCCIAAVGSAKPSGSKGSKAPVRSAAGNGRNPFEADLRLQTSNGRSWPGRGPIVDGTRSTEAIGQRSPNASTFQAPSGTPGGRAAEPTRPWASGVTRTQVSQASPKLAVQPSERGRTKHA